MSYFKPSPLLARAHRCKSNVCQNNNATNRKFCCVLVALPATACEPPWSGQSMELAMRHCCTGCCVESTWLLAGGWPLQGPLPFPYPVPLMPGDRPATKHLPTDPPCAFRLRFAVAEYCHLAQICCLCRSRSLEGRPSKGGIVMTGANKTNPQAAAATQPIPDRLQREGHSVTHTPHCPCQGCLWSSPRYLSRLRP